MSFRVRGVTREFASADTAVQTKVVVGNGEEDALRFDDHRHQRDDDVGLSARRLHQVEHQHAVGRTEKVMEEHERAFLIDIQAADRPRSEARRLFRVQP